MDEPTRAVAHDLLSKFRHLPDKAPELLSLKLRELKAFSETIFKKYFAEERGWNVAVGTQTPEEEKERHVMTLLLLDNNMYRF